MCEFQRKCFHRDIQSFKSGTNHLHLSKSFKFNHQVRKVKQESGFNGLISDFDLFTY